MSRQVQTLLFTDIVGSTDRLRDLGDAAWAALLVRHHSAIRAVLATHGGREVTIAGDGFLASAFHAGGWWLPVDAQGALSSRENAAV